MGTDKDWDKWGEIDPYFGVLSSDEYHAENLTDEAKAKFFKTGADQIDWIVRIIRRHLDPDFETQRALDFGCGVGRLVIPLAGMSDSVVGIDVSDHMLAEATANCAAYDVENVNFVKSTEGLSELNGEFNLIHSSIVLQHIPTEKGTQLISALLDHLEPGGVMAIQFYYACAAPRLIRALVKLRYKLPIANMARNLMRGRPLREPAMQLHVYDLGRIIDICKAVGVENFFFKTDEHGEFQSITLFAQRSS